MENYETPDALLLELKDTIDPILTRIDKDLTVERAVFIIASKETPEDDGEVSTQSYIDVVGDLGIIQDALYTELVELINSGNTGLFDAFREVVRTIEEEMHIDPEAVVSAQRTLH